MQSSPVSPRWESIPPIPQSHPLYPMRGWCCFYLDVCRKQAAIRPIRHIVGIAPAPRLPFLGCMMERLTFTEGAANHGSQRQSSRAARFSANKPAVTVCHPPWLHVRPFLHPPVKHNALPVLRRRDAACPRHQRGSGRGRKLGRGDGRPSQTEPAEGNAPWCGSRRSRPRRLDRNGSRADARLTRPFVRRRDTAQHGHCMDEPSC